MSTRYDQTRLEKDYRAMMNAIDRYKENVREIIADFPDAYIITSMDYRIQDIMDELNAKEMKWKEQPDHNIY